MFGVFQNSRTRLLDSITSRDNKIYQEMLDNVYEALDNEDKEGLKKLFAVNAIKENPDLDNQIDAFFQVFEGPVEIEPFNLSAGGSESIQYGKRQVISTNSYDITIMAGGVRYHIYMEIYSPDDFDKDNEGIHRLEFATEEAYNSEHFVFHYTWNAGPGLYYQDSAEKRDDLRWIDGHSWSYTYYDRKLTADDIRVVAEKSDDFDRFKAAVGEPNCAWDIYEYYYYELNNGLYAVVKVDHDLRPKDYYSNGKIVELNLFRPNAIVAIYIADEENNLETIWMADDIVKVLGGYRYFISVDRELTEDFFKSFALRSNNINKLIEEVGPPNIDETWYCYYKLSENRFVGCYYHGDNIEEIFVADSEDRLYIIWEKDDES